MASASTHSSATSSRSWLGSRRWAPYPGELSVSVKYPNFIVASSLRPLSAQRGVRLHEALVLRRVHGGNPVNGADDPHGGLADLGQHVALGEALADERDLALQAVLLVLLHEADRVDAGEERRHHVGIAPDLAEERREIRIAERRVDLLDHLTTRLGERPRDAAHVLVRGDEVGAHQDHLSIALLVR